MIGEHPSDAQLLLALDGELDAREAALVSDHVRGCAACRATWQQLAAVSRDVERYCRSWPPEAAVVASAMPTRDVPPRQRFRRERMLSRSAVLATAAAVLLALGAAWLLRPGAREPAAPQPAALLAAATRTNDIELASASANATAVANTSPSAATGPSPLAPPRAAASAPTRTSASAGARPSAAAAQVATRPRTAAATRTAARAQTLQLSAQQAAAQQAAAQRVATYYWALPYSNHALPLSEGAVVMTVRLSRDQLRLAGIPVSDLHVATDRDQALVRAKVLVGADGLPRAISFDQN
jgi:hypothetical protein